ncbi:hypothetical protein GGS24DRAFT_497862 [Hypoxylon argillaceum]|nr:hypothetical protein GGS24DRAFT_497862 [Hypoxylon argillaceum]
MASRTEAPTSNPPIALVGMACRLPGGATSPSKLWDLCTSGRDAWSTIPRDRFDASSLYDSNSEKVGRHHVRGGYFVEEDISRFDAGFFNLPADVANAMDPQVRLLLEVVYEATENAGLPLGKLSGSRTSVFAGNWGMDYRDTQTRDPELLTGPFGTCNTPSFISNRISHFYNLRGPSMSIDSACSSGLVALHEGCQSIWSGQSDMSVIGASSLILNQDLFISMTTLGFLGPNGRCFAWDTRAEGYGRGEGVVALILKPLESAISDGDRIHAVVRGTGVNQDGRTTTITSPSMEAQKELIAACYQRAGLDLADTGYVEAHMTGTQVGDLIEAEALARTFGDAQDSAGAVLVGSVKTNIGHTEPVSGLVAIIKAVVSMKHRQITPNQNYQTPNPKIKLDEWHLKVPTSLIPWPQGKAIRTSINNFGAGGTNAHVILEQAPASEAKLATGTAALNGVGHLAPQVPGRSRVYVLSASDSAACQRMAKSLGAYLREAAYQGSQPSAADLAYTMSERRSRLPWSAAVRARSVPELVERLESTALNPVHSVKHPRLGFVFNGQGAQWHAMGRELIAAYPVFAASIENANQILRAYGADWSLHDELLRDESSTRVAEINVSQPISVALQLCLVDLLGSWGIHPSAVTSHSSGEIAAAYAVGALSFEQALGVVYFRGELALKYQKQMSYAGGMLAAGVSAEEAERYIADTKSGRVVVACINSAESVTLSGDLSALQEVAQRLEKDARFARKLKVPLAYHSHHMVPMAPEYIDNLRSILPESLEGDGSVRFASPVTGTLLSPSSLTPEHWAHNLTNPVRFSEAFAALADSDANLDVIVEVGAHSTLSGPIRQILNGKNKKLAYTSCLKRPIDAVETMQELVSQLVCCGYPVNLMAVNSPFGKDSAEFCPDLPSYPWNHDTRYWLESRTNKEMRHKRFAPHELLGVPISGNTGALPTWRNFLRLADLPWLVDHQVDSKVVLPGAAYVVMAIEAIRLLTASTASSPSIQGYQLRDVEILNALAITESSEGVEVHTQLSPCSDRELDHRGWNEFKISSVDATGSWTVNCQGLVTTQPDNANKSTLYHEVDHPSESSYLDTGARIRDVDIPSLYSTLRKMNINHGPTFQNLLDCRVQGNKALASVCLPDVASETFAYVIHPTTLDTIIQAMFSTVPSSISQKNMLLPRSIGRMFIPSDLNSQAGSQLRVFTELLKSNKRSIVSNVVVSNPVLGATAASVMRIDGFYFQAVPMQSDGLGESGICFKSHWEPDILHAVPPTVKEDMKIHLSNNEAELERKLLRTSFDLIYDALVELKDDPKDDWLWYHRAMFSWMQRVVNRALSGVLYPGAKAWARTSKGIKQIRSDDLEASGVCGKLTVRVGRRLADIFRGNITAIELMMEDDLLNQYYMDIPRLKTRTYKHLRRVVEYYAVKNPGARVLEIGGGTGGATLTVLEGFGSRRAAPGGTLLGHYTFTDVSAGFFPAARQKLAAWTEMMDFAELDIEAGPAADSAITEGSYDLVVASLVLHATCDLKKTMANVRKFLRPGGKVLMIEATQDRLDTQLIFGTFEGWWLGVEPFRKDSPNASLEVWDDVLRATGFSGIEFDIGDCEDLQFQSCSTILATALSTPSYMSPISIIYTAEPKREWLTQLIESIHSLTGEMPSVEPFHELGDVRGKVCVFTGDMEGPFLAGIDEKAFTDLRTLVTSCQGLLWLSNGGLVDSTIPAFAQTLGFLRTLRLEQGDSRLVHLDFEHKDRPWTEDKIPFILRVFSESFDATKPSEEMDWEYAVRGSSLHVSRVYPDRDADHTTEDGEPQLQREEFFQPGRTLVWDPPPSGTLSNLVFTDGLDASGEVPDGMVQIEARAFGLNFRDVMIALGQLDDTLVGHDVAGIVTALGPGTEQSGLKVGDRVCALAKGLFASTGRAYWTGVAKIPQELSWADGAAIPVVYITAYHCLVRLGCLRRGQTVLIHAAAGGVGEAAIVVAQYLGARVVATCSTEAKKRLLVENYGIDPSHVFSSRDESFAPAVMALTQGKGVEVILNSLSGALLKATWGCIARFGRFIEIGKVDIEASRALDMEPFGRCATYAGFDALQLNEYDRTSTHEALVTSVSICRKRIAGAQGRRPLHPIAEYPISNLEEAMRKMQGGLHTGKLVLVPRHGDLVNVVGRPLSLARQDATYLIVGGVGGVGRSIASWAISQGAKNLILASRSAESSPEALELVAAAKEEGCHVYLRDCDVAEEQGLIDLITHFSDAGLPPIRGVVNGAMVLRDSVFERMTFEQWQHATKTKVNSSINLDGYLPDLDFFVLLASLNGQVGNVSQANYAAGNSFQDALVRRRASQGLSALSLDLSVVTDAGHVARQATERGINQVQARVEGLGTVSLSMEQIQGVLERKVLRRRRVAPAHGDLDDAQVIMGLAPWDQLPADSVVRRDRRFGTLRLGRQDGGGMAAAEQANPTGMLVKALGLADADEKKQSVARAVAERLAAIFNIAAEQVDSAASMAASGVDSLVAVELRNWLAGVAKAKVSVLEVVQSRSLLDFANVVIERTSVIKAQ